jgi:predicted O-linked N-acetylglucosamine transferase (SPINDLY family)
LANHDHERFEIFCYADVNKPDATTESLRRCTDSWRDISGMKHSQVAELVRRDRIDILIDLGLHTEGNRLLVFARKPAPVQATYLAYPGTSGLTSIDYRITDPYLDPPDAGDEFHSEKSIRVSHSYWCYDPPSSELAPARKSDRFTFGCLNNFCKVSPDCLRAWARILREMPEAQFFLHAGQGSHRQRVIETLANHGVADAPARVRFVDFAPIEEYFKAYHAIDVALDPFPYNGGTTTCDALWMGVPVVSLAGKTAVARAGLSLLANAGLPELVAGSEDEYVKIALNLSGNPKRLGEFRVALRARMRASKLMDGARFAREMEEAYRAMWKSWVAG